MKRPNFLMPALARPNLGAGAEAAELAVAAGRLARSAISLNSRSDPKQKLAVFGFGNGRRSLSREWISFVHRTR